MEEQHKAPISVISKSRLEMLFDGIFAIAMTILVLELKVPELVDRRSIGELARALARDAPTFGSYLLSFTVLGIFWYRHNHQFHHVRTITTAMLALHLVQLAAAAFFPFCAALLGRYPSNRLSLVVYTGCAVVYFWASLANWIVARRTGALAADLTPADYTRTRNRGIRGCAIMTALFGLYLVNVLAT